MSIMHFNDDFAKSGAGGVDSKVAFTANYPFQPTDSI
jgi:hypothetical protein